LAALAVCGALAAPALGTGPKGPRYSLRISAGESTFPEWEPVGSTSGGVEPSAQVAVSIVRGGVTVYRDIGSGGAGFSQVPQVGDVVTLESPVGTLIGSVVYDGLPTIDPTVCAGSTNFSGSNSLGEVVEGHFVNKVLRYRSGIPNGTHQTAFGEAQVKTLSGTTFGGTFLQPLALGEDVIAIETLKTPLPAEATYTYTSETERPVGACPVPPPVFHPPPPPVLQGTLGHLLHASIHLLLKSGLRDTVTINQPGTVVQDLYAKGGSMPASASATKHHKPPPALLLARGSATAKAAGRVTVVLHVTRHGRQRLHSAHKISAVLITTLHSTSGATLNLQRHTLTLHR
jgi:hypothetical protein